ncbi:Glycosyl hydrolases family 28 [Granulicella rosea]|uniref:Glycosyl hydrolases family 28 n=1 Tax=Granulicella rosea TaxID=474952 RepID=A0A239LZ49_9BACT|nr:glycosyl hydrolase family 28 protein [Granulicella rosea]SNT35073.1 Glycosyl hydrolases family 28 [Granulicella rosea]
MTTRRRFLYAGGVSLAALASPRYAFPGMQGGAEYNVMKYGAVGDGATVDTAAVQKAIDTAAAQGGGRVILPDGKRFLCGSLLLKSGIEFHFGNGATLVANTDPADYKLPGMLNADGAQGLKITSSGGSLDGQARLFMTDYDPNDERWAPKAFRPRMFSLLRTKDLEISNVNFGRAPQSGLYMLGCERVLVDKLQIRNYMNVPDCDGIVADRSREVLIQGCDLVGGGDSIVVKASEQKEDFGVSRGIAVHNCVVVSRESGLKVGTESFGDISKVLFEHCRLVAVGRGPTIAHRHAGNIEDIEFRDIDIVAAEHHADRWRGWGEAISITAWPETADGKVGTLKDVRLRNIRARAENSARIDGQKEQPVEDVVLEKVEITIDKWTDYEGGKFDNRPVAGDGLETHDTPAFSIRHGNKVLVKDCVVKWGDHPEKYWSSALEASDVQALKMENFNGEAAFPDAQKAVVVA